MTVPDSIVSSLATVLDRDENPIGYGLVVENDLVVTCAHVVAAALTGDGGNGAGPFAELGGDTVTLEFTTEDALVPMPGLASEAGWRAMVLPLPPRPEDRVSDLVLLRLDRPLPSGIAPYPWETPADSYNQLVEVLGFKDGRAQWTYCQTSNRVPRTAWLQVSVRHDAPRDIDRGCSGSPIVRQDDGVVLGLLQAKDDTGRLSGGYMIRWREVQGLLKAHLQRKATAEIQESLRSGLIPAASAAQMPFRRTPASVQHDPDYPGLAQYYVDRPKLHERLRERLLASEDSLAISGSHLGLGGMGGVGKTVLAAKLVSDPHLAHRYPDGIFWMTLGSDVDVLAAQSRLLGKIGHTGKPPDDVRNGQFLIENAFAGRTALVVLDDVWEPEVVDAFPVGRQSRLLITTRFGQVVDRIGGSFPIDLPTREEAREILRRHAGASVTSPEATDALIDDLVSRAGRLPMALAVIGSMAEKSGGQWDALQRHLQADHLLELRQRLPDYKKYASVYQCLGASVDRLDRKEKEAFLALAVLPEDVGADLDLLGLIWADLADDEIGALMLANELVDANLANWSPSDELILHDLSHAYSRAAAADLPARHGVLADAYRRATHGAWEDDPSAPYMLEHLPRHLKSAGRDGALGALLVEYAWLSAHLSVFGTTHRAELQLQRFGSDESHRLLGAILRQMRHVLLRYPGQLAEQIIGRVLPDDPAQLRSMADAAKRSLRDNSLLPLRASLRRASTELTLMGHSGVVEAVAVSADGNRAVSGSNDRTLRVWDLETGETVRTLEGHGDVVLSVAVSADGRRAVSGSDDGTMRVWDLETGETVRTLEVDSGGVKAVAVSSDGKRAVSGSVDGTLWVWDLETGETVDNLECNGGGVRSVAVSADGRRAVSGSVDGTLWVWDLETGETVRSLEGHGASVLSVAVSADGRRAVSGSGDSALRVWDLETGEIVRTLGGHRVRVDAVAVSADGRWAVSGSVDGTLRVWDLEVGKTVRRLEGHGDWVLSVAVSSDGLRAVSGSVDGTVRVWDLETGGTVRSLEGHGDSVLSVAMSADGSRAASGSVDRTLRVWDLETGETLRSLEGHGGYVRSVAVSADGRRGVSGSPDRTMRVWDLQTGETVRTLKGHDDWVNAVAVSADGRLAISGSVDGTLQVWDLDTGETVRTLKGYDDWVNALAVSADGRRAVSGSGDRTLGVWDLDTGETVRTLKGHDDWVNAVAVSANGRRAVSGSDDRTLRVWDIETGETLRTLEGHRGGLKAVAMSADGKGAVSGSVDGTLRVWNLETAEMLRELFVESQVLAVAARGRTVVAGDFDGRVHVFEWLQDGADSIDENR